MAEDTRARFPVGSPYRLQELQQKGSIFDSLLDYLELLLETQPGQEVGILTELASSSNYLARFMVAFRLDVAYFSGPEKAHDLISRLIEDPDPRVRQRAYTTVQNYVDSFGYDDGARSEDDARGLISSEYLHSLPLDLLREYPNGRTIVATNFGRGWWPTSS